MWFEAIFGLKNNLDKGEVILLGGIANAKNPALVLECRIGKLPTSYLGLPLGASFNSKVWDVVEERFRKILAM